MTRYSVLHPATFKLDGGAMFGIIPKPLWEKKIPSDEYNRIHMSLRVLLIQKENKVILIDTGIGDYHPEKFQGQFAVCGNSNPLLECLAQANLTADDVTDIVLTHLHFDHVGGLGTIKEEKSLPLFPEAKIHLHKDHYEYALAPTQRDAGSFQTHYFKPLIDFYKDKNSIHWIEGSEGEILSGLYFKTSHGHTPHQIHPYDEKFIYMADILPTSAHLSIPWVMGYDINAGQSTKDKEELYQFILDKNLTIIFEHDIQYWGGKMNINEKKKYAWDQLLNSSAKTFESIDL